MRSLPWVGDVDSAYWAADFRVARVIHHVYTRLKRRMPVVVVGLSGPQGHGVGPDPGPDPGQIGPTVARDLAKAHPYVFGASDRPVRPEEAGGLLHRIGLEFPGSLVLAVEGVPAPPGRDGRILAWSWAVEGDEEFLEPTPGPEGFPPPPVPWPSVHLHLLGLVGPGHGSPAAAQRRVHRTADAITDGILRFFYRIGQIG